MPSGLQEASASAEAGRSQCNGVALVVMAALSGRS